MGKYLFLYILLIGCAWLSGCKGRYCYYCDGVTGGVAVQLTKGTDTIILLDYIYSRTLGQRIDYYTAQGYDSAFVSSVTDPVHSLSPGGCLDDESYAYAKWIGYNCQKVYDTH